jgi:hypothetical protein
LSVITSPVVLNADMVNLPYNEINNLSSKSNMKVLRVLAFLSNIHKATAYVHF